MVDINKVNADRGLADQPFPRPRWGKGNRPQGQCLGATALGLAALPQMIAQDLPGLCCLCEAPAATRDLWLVLHPDLR